jgi:hypothetical protein
MKHLMGQKYLPSINPGFQGYGPHSYLLISNVSGAGGGAWAVS